MNSRCPVLDLPEVYMMNKEDGLADRLVRLVAAGGKLAAAASLWEVWSEREKQTTLVDILKVL